MRARWAPGKDQKRTRKGREKDEARTREALGGDGSQPPTTPSAILAFKLRLQRGVAGRLRVTLGAILPPARHVGGNFCYVER